MKQNDDIEIPELYFERNPIIVLSTFAIAIILDSIAAYLFFYKDFETHGWALLLVPPGMMFTFQALIFLLNPYLLIFKDRVELKRNMFSNRTWYFNDIKLIGEPKNNKISLTYNDDDVEMINLSGIKPSHLKKFKLSFEEKINETLIKRETLVS